MAELTHFTLDYDRWIGMFLLAVGCWWIVPQTLNHYALRWFEHPAPLWDHPRVPLLAFITSLLLLELQTTPGFALIGWAAILVALWGTIRLDTAFQVIPDRFHLLGGIGSFLILASTSDLETALKRVLFGSIFAAALWFASWSYEKLRQRQAMGRGDIKMLAWLGMLTGLDVLQVLFFACLACLCVIAPRLLRKTELLHETFAFGPYLAVGLILRQAAVLLFFPA